MTVTTRTIAEIDPFQSAPSAHAWATAHSADRIVFRSRGAEISALMPAARVGRTLARNFERNGSVKIPAMFR